MKDTETKLDRIWEKIADFSGLQGYDGWMIGSAVLRRLVPEADDIGAQRRKVNGDMRRNDVRMSEEKRGNFAVIKNSMDCGDQQYTLELHVVKPGYAAEGSDAAANAKSTPGHGEPEVVMGELFGEYRVSASEILQFTETVGDTNPIHRTQRPVVPGLLMFRRFLEHIESAAPDMPEQNPVTPKIWSRTDQDFPISVTWKMRFFAPLFAGETVQMYRRSGKDGRNYYCGYEKKRGVCIWNVYIS